MGERGHGPAVEPREYDGYGICPNGCGGYSNGRRVSTMERYRMDEHTTADRCRQCGAQWLRRDHQRGWFPW